MAKDVGKSVSWDTLCKGPQCDEKSGNGGGKPNAASLTPPSGKGPSGKDK
jgi:hypothetical protein